MRFDGLLWECLLPGRHEHSEENLTAALDPRPGETVLLFETDRPAFRRRLPAGSKLSVCDLMFFYRGPAAPMPVLLFVELKGSDYEHAEEQLANALEAVTRELEPDCQRSVLKGAVVVLGASTPHDSKRRRREFFRSTRTLIEYESNARAKRTELRSHLEKFVANADSRP